MKKFNKWAGGGGADRSKSCSILQPTIGEEKILNVHEELLDMSECV